MNERILVVDDEPNMRTILRGLLMREGYQVEEAADGLEALSVLERCGGEFQAIITDLRMPEMDGMQLLAQVVDRYPDRSVVVITAHGTVDTAVEAMKAGAFDFISKPFDKDELRGVVRKAVDMSRAQLDAVEPAETDDPETGRYGMIGRSPAMKEVYNLLDKVAAKPSAVLITGESGTGKEMVASALHKHSSRAGHPFIALNCAAIPETLFESELFGHEEGAFTGAISMKPGRFELADGGTLFLDEVAEIPIEMQVKLLRVLQEGTFERVGGTETLTTSVRLVAATNRELSKEVEGGRFREDLYYRLNVVPIHLPPLRERPTDIPLLVAQMLERFNERLQKNVTVLAPEADIAFKTYTWPGNVREMENVLERLVLFCEGDEITQELLPDEMRREPGQAAVVQVEDRLDRGLTGRVSMKELVRETTAQVERKLIIQALEQTGGNVTRAAQLLMISRKSLQNKMKEFNLRDEE
ncbi:MAG: sigma-54 dependent transcriptional regulator [Myxococcota bacterium]|nr:sigma-54 dependent transcriptional regulator [Myxococcota bacterium]